MLNATTKEIIEHYNDMFDNILNLDKNEKYEKYNLLCLDLSDGLARYKKFTNEMFNEILEGVLDIELNENQKKMHNVKEMFNKYSLKRIGVVNNIEQAKKNIEEMKKDFSFENIEFRKIENSNKYEILEKIYFYKTMNENDFKDFLDMSNNINSLDR